MLLVALVLTLSDPVPPQQDALPPMLEWKQPKAWETGVLLAAHTLIVIDVLQTLAARRSHVVIGEHNPFLGNNPSSERIIVVGCVVPVVALTALWYALPSKWRILAPAAVIGPEAFTIFMNATEP